MKIFIKTINGINFVLDVEPTDTINAIKAKIEYKEGTPSHGQCLIFGGKQLKKNNTIEEYKIENQSVVQLVNRFSGS